MVEEKQFERGGTVKIRYHILSHREVAQMDDTRLREHVDYLNRQLRLWDTKPANEPAWAANAAAQWRGALNRELRRVNAELRYRENSARHQDEVSNVA